MEIIVENKKCAKCKGGFTVTDKDMKLYEKLDIPSPQLCPICRVQRRMAWRNDRTFYLRKCDKSGKQMISTYPPDMPFPAYHPTEWYSDSWNPLDYGQEFDFSKPFFEQWRELMLKVPRLGIDIVNCENSDYCNFCGDDKNCYLDIAGEANEDSYYNLFTKYSKNCVDCTFVYNSELCYEAISCYRCYNVRHSMYLENCNDCYFCFDLKGCKNCLFSSNLRQKEYYIFNKPFTREEYQKYLAELDLGSYAKLAAAVAKWKEVMSDAIHRDMYNLNSENCTGNDIQNSKNCSYVFNISNCEDCKYLYDVLDAKDCYDMSYSLYKPEVCCDIISTLSMKRSAFCMASHYCTECLYCDQCNNSSNLFGCIGLNRKQYCILNKQYKKEEYEELLPKIIEHMKKIGEWGEFFPSAISPFGYNETVAQEYYPLTKERAQSEEFKWKDSEERGFYDGPKYQVPDNIKEVSEDPCKQVLVCEISGKPYKVIGAELKFYKKMGIPVPRRSPDQRHRDRIAIRNPRWLWTRNCSQCGTQISTSYRPERKEKIFCAACYEKFIYN